MTKHSRISSELNSCQKQKAPEITCKYEINFNDKICSVWKVWNSPLYNLPARKRIIRTWHGTTLFRLRFFPRKRQGSQSVTRNWMCRSFIAAWIANLNKYERTSRRTCKLGCYKSSFQNYGKPGHVNWIFNSINNKKLQRLATQTVSA